MENKMITNPFTFVSLLLLSFFICLKVSNAEQKDNGEAAAAVLEKLQNNAAQENEDAAIKDIFLKLDGIKIIGEELNSQPWRIAQGTDEWDALGNKKIPLEGITTIPANNKITVEGFQTTYTVAYLSKQQRKALASAWQKTPNQLWFIVNSHPLQLVPVNVQGQYQIQLMKPDDIRSTNYRLKSEKEEVAMKTPLPVAAYTQQNFDAKAFIEEYEEWRGHFKEDIASFKAEMQKDHDYGRKIASDKDTDAFKDSFSQSIHTGAKGLALRLELIESYYASGGHEGTEVMPTGALLTQQILDTYAKPVGFGGTFIDEGNTVELWYMVFDEMSKWSMQDLNESFNFKAFSPAVLPPYKTIKRNSWPALIFIRDEHGKVMLYGMSKEMARILQTIQHAQTF